MKNMIKDAAILLVITLFSGLILGLVYGITKEPIALAEEKAAKEDSPRLLQKDRRWKWTAASIRLRADFPMR